MPGRAGWAGAWPMFGLVHRAGSFPVWAGRTRRWSGTGGPGGPSMVAVAKVFGMSSSNLGGSRADRQGPFHVGDLDNPVEALGRAGGNRQKPIAVDANKIHAGGPGNGFVDAVIGKVPALESPEVFHAQPGHGHALIDGLLAECLQKEGFAGAGKSAGRFSRLRTHFSVRKNDVVAAGRVDGASAKTARACGIRVVRISAIAF